MPDLPLSLPPLDTLLAWLLYLVFLYVGLSLLVGLYHWIRYGHVRSEFDLEPGEEMVQAKRKHWFLFLLELLPFAILAVIPLLIPSALALAGPTLSPYASYFDWSLSLPATLLGGWWLLVATAAFNAFTRAYLNLWVLTNHRIVDIKQRRYFNRVVSSLLLGRVQDVTIDVEGVLESLLGFGDIHVQSAGTTERFRMRGIPRPEAMRDIILKYVATPRGGAPVDRAV